MGHSVTLGGDRVGSGNKNKVYLHNYERSTHNLSRKFSSTMGVGMLIPFMVELATRDDKFEIDLNAGLRTIPTKGPLFGSFKLQLDVYQCPLRLYQALLHNNPLAIGLKANQVKFPKMRLYGHAPLSDTDTYTEIKAANNSLIKYLGVSGIGSAEQDVEVHRDLFGAGVLAYYDIFKNYYANKQEENAYTCSSAMQSQGFEDFTMKFFTSEGASTYQSFEHVFDRYEFKYDSGDHAAVYVITGDIEKAIDKESVLLNTIYLKYSNGSIEQNFDGTLKEGLTQRAITEINITNDAEGRPNRRIIIKIRGSFTAGGQTFYFVEGNINDKMEVYNKEVILKPFALKTIDDMRMEILSYHQLGSSFLLDADQSPEITNSAKSPYLDALGTGRGGEDTDYLWQKPLSGICVKTYQSDIFNNWINTEWIDGENGIAAITAISTSDGKITIDALNFSEKLYNLLNRIAVSGATYEDYLDAAYTDSAKKFCEAPMWIGGLSDEIVFEEIVQTNSGDETSPLGTLAGRGNLLGKHKGGKITCKIDEPSLIIGIVSITPRINYTQGNEWFNTEIDSLMDIHVPAMDGIAFQNLLGERLHFASTIVNQDGSIEDRPIIGKIPAWLEYMTSYDRAFGDFAATGGDGYMILQRDYLCENGELKDATTYIDPAKFNYAFAYTKRDAQNFWVEIYAEIKARRLMSAKQIPNV